MIVGGLPLSPFRQAVADALASTTSPDIAWASLAVMAAWGVAAAIVARRLLRTKHAGPGGGATAGDA